MSCKRIGRIFCKFDNFSSFFLCINLRLQKALKVFQKLFHILPKRVLLKNSESLLPLWDRQMNTGT